MAETHGAYKNKMVASSIAIASSKMRAAVECLQVAVAHHYGRGDLEPVLCGMASVNEAFQSFYLYESTKPEMMGDHPHPQLTLRKRRDLLECIRELDAVISEDLRQMEEWNEACENLPAPRPREVRPVAESPVTAADVLATMRMKVKSKI